MGADVHAVDQEDGGVAAQIGGLCVLKGLILYGATLTFAGFYAYFIVEIFGAKSGQPPHFDAAMISASAALAGVLGSAFAIVIGVPTTKDQINPGIEEAIKSAPTRSAKIIPWLRKILSLEPGHQQASSWPLTFGIWVYALTASAVAVTYFVNQHETPATIKTLALAFAGYVIALVTAAYGLATKSG